MSPYIKNFQNNNEFSDRELWRVTRFLRANLVLFVLILLIIVFSFVYLKQVNELSKVGYAIRNTEKNLAVLKNRGTELSVKISAVKSQQKIEEFIGEFEMVEVKGIDGIGYVQVMGSQTALK